MAPSSPPPPAAAAATPEPPPAAGSPFRNSAPESPYPDDSDEELPPCENEYPEEREWREAPLAAAPTAPATGGGGSSSSSSSNSDTDSDAGDDVSGREAEMSVRSLRLHADAAGSQLGSCVCCFACLRVPLVAAATLMCVVLYSQPCLQLQT
jgi:hypothetical protein